MAVKLVTQETLTDCGLACVAMVSGQSLATVRKVAIKELGYPKDGPYTTTHENLFKLLAHFGIGHGKKAPFKSLAARRSEDEAEFVDLLQLSLQGLEGVHREARSGDLQP